MLRRLRYGDWVCGLAACALLVALFAVEDHDWGSLGRPALVLAVLLVLVGLAVPLTAVRTSPAAGMLALVGALLVGVPTVVVVLAEGALLALAAAVGLVVGALLAMRDERSPGRPDRPVERRPAPPASA